MTSQTPPVGGVLCAGFGSRMAPITEVIPKPLVPFLNTPILAYSLDHLATAGVTRVGMNLHHLPDSIPPVANQLVKAMNIEPTYVREWEILGTAGGVRGIWEGLGEPETTMIVFNGDSVMNIDLLEVLGEHRESQARATLVVRPKEGDKPGGVWIDPDNGRLMGLRDFRHPNAGDNLVEYGFNGVHFIEPELSREIPLEWGCMVGDVYGPLLEEGEDFNLVVSDDFWASIDNPSLLYEATRRVLATPSIFEQVPLPEALGEGLYVFRQEGIDDKTEMAGPLLTGAHVKTGPGVKIGPAAVIDGVELTAGTSVRHAIIYGSGILEGKWHRCVSVAGKVANLPESVIQEAPAEISKSEGGSQKGASESEGQSSEAGDV